MPDEVRIATLEAQVRELRQQMAWVSHWHDTLHTPWYKSLWFFVQGYRLRTLGTWYSAPWNKKMGDKYKAGI